MQFQTNRRTFLMGGTALGLGLAMGTLPAFAQASNLRLMFWGGQDRADRTNGVGDLFKDATGVSIDTEFMSGSDYWPKLATQTAGGSAPDIMQMDYQYLLEYAKRGALAPLDEFVGEQLKLDGFDVDQLNGGKVDGKLFGVSLGANSVAAIVNTTAFEEAGIDLPTNDWNYEDIFETGQAFAKANIRGGMTMIADFSGSVPAFENWLRQKKRALYTADGQLGFGAEEATQWLTMWKEFRDAGVTVSAENAALSTGALETTSLVSGKSAITHAHSNQLLGFQALMQDRLGLIGYPRLAKGVGGGHYRKPSQLFAVASTSQGKKEAAEFINFFVSNPEAAKILGVERGVPCLAATRDVVAPTLSEENRAAVDFVTNLGDLLGALPPPPPSSSGEIELSLLPSISQEVAFDARTPEDASQYFVSEASAILERAS
ncbi:ABC transporter ATP-binding protein [Devosia sp. Root685]|uniref:ABC transporter substrate-binding protein n=1 Tax=Devosia sp. Root685 TaxID=1736587 RepID=UPI0006F8D8F7|nr:ABC transporter substrate-binding protein [Devosia sp. Root685]KRB01131.1 ABC transporter ATP-binding protein [Devosia sp. Root685]